MGMDGGVVTAAAAGVAALTVDDDAGVMGAGPDGKD
jgi:hypothetical protein